MIYFKQWSDWKKPFTTFSQTSPLSMVVFFIGVILLLFLASNLLTTSVESKENAAMVYEPAEELAELPVRLVIPSIGVDAEVQYVGLALNGSGEMAVPSNFTDVGWYENGVRPGMRGSAVITGHFNGKETPEAVFYDLRTLRIGDEVVVMSADRVEAIFHVVKIETYDYDAPTTEVFTSVDGKKKLNLITCGGEWLPDKDLFNKRTVVFTESLQGIE